MKLKTKKKTIEFFFLLQDFDILQNQDYELYQVPILFVFSIQPRKTKIMLIDYKKSIPEILTANSA